MTFTEKGGWKVISVYPKTVIKIWILPLMLRIKLVWRVVKDASTYKSMF